MDKQLANEPWYHGLLPREDIKMMLRNNGDFLVRTTEPVAGKPRALVLSVMVKQELEDQGIKHFVITVLPSGKVMIEKYAFESVSSMVEYHLSKKDSLTKVRSRHLSTCI
ncbi:SH2 domain protein [Cooperia oncophora]